MKESDLHRHIVERSRGLAGRGVVLVGPGDDTAALALGGVTLATVDQVVEGRHFELGGAGGVGASIDLIARKAVARSISDIAAMGGVPVCALATGCLRSGFAHGDELFDRMSFWAERFGCPLVGGDIAYGEGPLVLSVTALGRAHAKRGPVLRSEARVGDEVYVTGRLGGSLGSGRHLSFEPRIVEGEWLAESLGDRLGGMIDISDGLGRDAGRVASASGVRLELEAGALPLHAGGGDWRRAVGEGEDYELLFTARSGSRIESVCPVSGVEITRIGRVVEGAGTVIECDGELIDGSEMGWEHGP